MNSRAFLAALILYFVISGPGEIWPYLDPMDFRDGCRPQVHALRKKLRRKIQQLPRRTCARSEVPDLRGPFFIWLGWLGHRASYGAARMSNRDQHKVVNVMMSPLLLLLIFFLPCYTQPFAFFINQTVFRILFVRSPSSWPLGCQYDQPLIDFDYLSLMLGEKHIETAWNKTIIKVWSTCVRYLPPLIIWN